MSNNTVRLTELLLIKQAEKNVDEDDSTANQKKRKQKNIKTTKNKPHGNPTKEETDRADKKESDRSAREPYAVGGGATLGAAAGGALGYSLSDKRNKVRNAVLAALGGGIAGGVAGHVANKFASVKRSATGDYRGGYAADVVDAVAYKPSAVGRTGGALIGAGSNLMRNKGKIGLIGALLAAATGGGAYVGSSVRGARGDEDLRTVGRELLNAQDTLSTGIGAVGGAGLGGALGYGLSDENQARNTILAALAGGALGGVGGYVANKSASVKRSATGDYMGGYAASENYLKRLRGFLRGNKGKLLGIAGGIIGTGTLGSYAINSANRKAEAEADTIHNDILRSGGGALGGGAIGGALGYGLSDDENKVRNAILGTLGGGAVGGIAGHYADRFIA